MSPRIAGHRPPVVRPPPPPARRQQAQSPRAPDRSRYADSFEPARSRSKQDRPVTSTATATATAPASRLERSAAFGRLTPEVQERVRQAGVGASPTAERNLSRVVSARGFSRLTVERQTQMLDVYSRHREDSRVASSLSGLANRASFRSSDPAAQTAAVREAAIPARLRGDALQVLNTTEPQHITVNGQPIDVYGANASELETIRTTLGLLPRSHLATIPRVVVGDTIGHGNNERGGAWVPQRTIDAYEAGTGGGRNAAAYRAERWTNPPRLELTHESLARARDHVSPTILHETGHAVDEKYRLSRGMSAESLGGVDYNGAGHGAEGDLGPVNERFADGYMRYYLGTLRRDPVANRTVTEAIASVPE